MFSILNPILIPLTPLLPFVTPFFFLLLISCLLAAVFLTGKSADPAVVDRIWILGHGHGELDAMAAAASFLPFPQRGLPSSSAYLEYTQEPVLFGAPYHDTAFNAVGLRTVSNGPRSPVRSKAQMPGSFASLPASSSQASAPSSPAKPKAIKRDAKEGKQPLKQLTRPEEREDEQQRKQRNQADMPSSSTTRDTSPRPPPPLTGSNGDHTATDSTLSAHSTPTPTREHQTIPAPPSGAPPSPPPDPSSVPPTPSHKAGAPDTKPPARTPAPASPASTSQVRPRNGEINLHWPSFAKEREAGRGLINPRMACYANSIIQVLFYTPPVLLAAIEHQKQDCPTNEYCLLCAVVQLCPSHWKQTTNPRGHYAPRLIHDNLNRIRKGFKTGRQEDAHEFFRFATDNLGTVAQLQAGRKKPAQHKNDTWIHKTWGGQVRSRVVCQKCHASSDTFDHFLDLSVDVPRSGQANLRGMLANYVKEDRLEGDNQYKCEKCKQKSNATKALRIDQAPPVLTFHLKRFTVQYGRWGTQANKYTRRIEYPEYLDMAPFMVDPKTSHKYKLFGVTCHSGSTVHSGHYTSYVRSHNDKWYDADDESVRKVSIADVLRDHDAYILSYMQVADDDFPQSNRSRSASTSTVDTSSIAPREERRSEPSPVKRKWEGVGERDTKFNRFESERPTKRDKPDSRSSARGEGRLLSAQTGIEAALGKLAGSEPDSDEEDAASDHGTERKWGGDMGGSAKKKFKPEQWQKKLKHKHKAPQPYKAGGSSAASATNRNGQNHKSHEKKGMIGKMQRRSH